MKKKMEDYLEDWMKAELIQKMYICCEAVGHFNPLTLFYFEKS